MHTGVLVNEQRSRILMAKKAVKTTKPYSSKSRTSRKPTMAQAPRAGDAISSSVLDRAMEDVI